MNLSKLESLSLQEILKDIQAHLPPQFEAFDKGLDETQKTYLNFLVKVLNKTRNELRCTNTFTTLVELRTSEEFKQREESLLRHDLCVLEAKFRELQASLETEGSSWRARKRTQRDFILQLKEKLRSQREKGVQRKTAILRTLFEAQQQSKVTHATAVGSVINNVSQSVQQAEQNCTAYENLAAWTKLQEIKLNETISSWKKKLELESKNFEEEIEEKKVSLIGQGIKIQELQKKIEDRVEELIPWEEEKEQERLERIQHMRRYYSARKIQRWWRKCMNLHGLYKKKKPSKPKKGKAGKSAKSPRKSKQNVLNCILTAAL